MNQMEVQNVTAEEIAVMWDGQQVYFRPGQKKAFAEGVARGISEEADGLELVEEKKVVEVDKLDESPVKEPVEANSKPVVSEKDNYTETVTKKGIVQYRKNGKIIRRRPVYTWSSGAVGRLRQSRHKSCDSRFGSQSRMFAADRPYKVIHD